MLTSGKAIRNSAGKVVKAADYQSREVPRARVEPNKRWFNNTRVIAQRALEQFRESLGQRMNDPYSVLLKQNKLPMSLLTDSSKQSRMHVLETETFKDTFGSKAQRKKPRLDVGTFEDLVNTSEQSAEAYEETKDSALLSNNVTDYIVEARESIFSKGQSKRIWAELYKVVDSSDVIIHVLDARDPEGTRCKALESYIKKEVAHKHLVFVLNKCDLVPNRVAVSTHFPCPPQIVKAFALVNESIAVSCYICGRSSVDPPRRIRFETCWI